MQTPLDKLKQKISEDYLNNVLILENPNATIDDVNILHFYGAICISNDYSYSYGSAAIMIVDSYHDVIWNERAARIVIKYNSNNRIIIWNTGKFYNLGDAFLKGLITQNQVIEINNQQKLFYPFLYENDEWLIRFLWNLCDKLKIKSKLRNISLLFFILRLLEV